jgi:DNA invertase Pin-like site-specific DNA recombinase
MSLDAEVDHIDRNRQNNRLENLRLVYKDENRCRKLAYKDAEEIRRRYAEGETQKALAKAYGISKTAVGEIVRRETYKHPPKEMTCRRL